LLPPTNSEPSDPGPIEPGPIEPGPIDPGPIDPGPIDPGPIDPGPINPTPPSSISLNGYTISGNFYPVFQNYQGTLGNPTSDVINYGGASYQLFDNGSIVSSANGTFPLYGGIRQAFLNTGGLEGWLGAPKSEEKGLGNGNIIQYFEHGYIYWNGSKAIAYKGESNETPTVQKPSNTPIQSSGSGANSPILTAQELANSWQNWPEYSSNNPFPDKGQNCTWYAHGRMLQLGYSKAALDTMWGNAGTWDNTAGNGATVSNTPQAPSIAVWEIGVGGVPSNGVGHVAVVERVNPDGSILISESNWADTQYNTRTISPGDSHWPSEFVIVPRDSSSNSGGLPTNNIPNPSDNDLLVANASVQPGQILKTVDTVWGAKNIAVGAISAGKNVDAVLAAIRAFENGGNYGSNGGSTPGDAGAGISIGAYQESYPQTYLPIGNSVMGTNLTVNQFYQGNPLAQDTAAIGRLDSYGLLDQIKNSNLSDEQQRWSIAQGIVNAWGSWYSDADQIHSTPAEKNNYKLAHSQAILAAVSLA
jgi:surface antigen